jgi:hypothetical protein
LQRFQSTPSSQPGHTRGLAGLQDCSIAEVRQYVGWSLSNKELIGDGWPKQKVVRARAQLRSVGGAKDGGAMMARSVEPISER